FPGRLARASERTFEAVKRWYERNLARTLDARPAVYAVWIVVTALVIPMYLFSPVELAPLEDQGVLFGALDMPANATLEQLTPYTEQVQHTFASVPEFEQSFQVTFPQRGFGGALMKPWDERKRNIFAIQEDLSPRLLKIAGVRAPVFAPPPLPSPGLFPVEFVISSTGSYDELMRFADQLVQEAAKSGQFAFPPVTDVKIDKARTSIVVDRDKAASMGMSMQSIGAYLSAMLGGNFVNRFSLYGLSYKVIPEVERSARLNPQQLGLIRVTGPDGSLVPLSSIATFHQTVEPRTLNRFQQLNSIKISGVAPRSVDAALRTLEDAAARILPASYHVDYTGQSRQLRQESGKFAGALVLAIVLIFLVLAAQFNSFRDPFIILAGSVPLAMFGALLFTFLKFSGPPGLHFALTDPWTSTLNIYSQVGLVTLAGLVSKNGILIVQFANVQQEAGLSKLEAVRIAAATRLRPVLMTTIATIAGHFILTFVTGPGAAARNSIGRVLVGGMAVGTTFTLFVVPSLYVLMAKDHRKERERLAREEERDATSWGAGTASALR
ncbi:MAG: efflux RND transporter permease subunit, partial [Polyangiaceae bacterium]